MGAITFLVGGVRSGKSVFAVEIGRRHDGAVVFVATAVGFDEDMRARVARHRAFRPDWPTVEAPLDPTSAVADSDPRALVIVDCMTVWVGNLMHCGDAEEAIARRTDALVAELVRRSGPSVVVSNEVGMGVHPETDLGRSYRQILGTVNQKVARAAHRNLLLVAGRALPLMDPWDALG